MNRREFLHRAGASAAVAGLAGCLGSAALDGGSPSDDGSSPDEGNSADARCETSEKSSADDFSGVESDAAEPFREISLGSRDAVAFPENDRPRTVRVWNAADATRTVDLRVARETDRLFDEAIEFAPDAYLTVTLAEPADYSVSVGVSGDVADGSCDSGAGDDASADPSSGTTGGASAHGAAFPVPRSAFDCNFATIDVGVMPDGRIETLEEATTMGCPGPRIGDSTFSTERGNCGTEDRASVGFDRERVRIEGAVRTPTPQWSLELAAVKYDEEADRLVVRVRATESESDDVGVQCIAEVPYEATVGFESALPSEVVVVHEANGETTEAARVTR